MPLITIYGVSPTWMLLGSGKKYKKFGANTYNKKSDTNLVADIGALCASEAIVE